MARRSAAGPRAAAPGGPPTGPGRVRVAPRGPDGAPGRYTVAEPSGPSGLPGDLPLGGVDIPDNVLDGLPFAALDGGLPLLLLPVRLETRLVPSDDPAELRIRIFPDQVHVDASPAGGSTRTAARAVLLPGQWMAIGYADGEEIFRETSGPVQPDLRIGPDAGASATDVLGGDFVIDDGLAWMVDYDRAVEVGHGDHRPPGGQRRDPGSRPDRRAPGRRRRRQPDEPADAADELARLLDVHAASTGLSFVLQGTPTNTTA